MFYNVFRGVSKMKGFGISRPPLQPKFYLWAFYKGWHFGSINSKGVSQVTSLSKQRLYTETSDVLVLVLRRWKDLCQITPDYYWSQKAKKVKTYWVIKYKTTNIVKTTKKIDIYLTYLWFLHLWGVYAENCHTST